MKKKFKQKRKKILKFGHEHALYRFNFDFM